MWIWDLDAMNNFKNNQTPDVRVILFPFFPLGLKGNSVHWTEDVFFLGGGERNSATCR